jgi:hypothetical protein
VPTRCAISIPLPPHYGPKVSLGDHVSIQRVHPNRPSFPKKRFVSLVAAWLMDRKNIISSLAKNSLIESPRIYDDNDSDLFKNDQLPAPRTNQCPLSDLNRENDVSEQIRFLFFHRRSIDKTQQHVRYT